MKKGILEGIFLTAFSILTLVAQAVTVSETHTNITCYGGTSGSINITAAGGTLPYTYTWSDGPAIEDRTNLVAGTYTVTVTDFLGATVQRTITITQGPDMITSKNITPVSCGGGSDGAIDYTVSGANPPFSFLWSDGNTNEDRINIIATNYYLTITDGIGCTKIDSANVIQPMGMVPSVAVTDANCNASNGHIDLTVQYGYPAYSYLWNDGPTAEDRVSLAMGTYSVTITDSIGCQVSISATVNQANETLNIGSVATNPTCFGSANGSINITAVTGGTPPFTFYWSDSSTAQNHTGLTAGAYTVTVTSAHNCTATKTFNLTQPSALGITLSPVNVQCYGGNNGAINTTVTGGTGPYTYNWGSGVTTQNRTGLTAGTYTVTATDSKGCTITASATLTQPTQVVVTTTTTPIACTGGNTGAVYTNVTGGTGTGTYNYWWGGVNFSANRINVGAGTYTVTVTDANNCTATASSTINSYIPLSVSRTVTNATCAGSNNGAINVTVNNGWSPYSYSWNTGDTTQDLNSLAPGTYTLTITDNHACTATVTGNVTQPASAITVNAAVSNVSCNGNTDGAITLTLTGGATPYGFNWGSGITSQNRSNLAAGSYAVTVTDNNSCTATGSYNITEPTPIALTTAVTNVSCNSGSNGAINLTVSGGTPGYTYVWNSGQNSQDRASLTAGGYSVTVTDSKTCTASISATITQPAVNIISLNKGDVTCNGNNNGWITLNTSIPGNYTYNWTGNVHTQNRINLAAGNYSVTVTDSSGCNSYATTTITQPTAVVISSSVTPVSCNGGNNGTVSVSASGGMPGYNFTWSGSNTGTYLTGLAAGVYQVTATDNSTCTSSASITVGQPAALTLSTTAIKARCYGQGNGRINLTVTGGAPGYSYLWSNNNTGLNLVNKPAGTYTVTVTDSRNCTATATDSIQNPPVLTASLTGSNLTCFGANNGAIDLTVAGGTPAYSYHWTNNDSTEDLSNISSGLYRVTVTDANTCSTTATITLTVPSPVQASTTHTDISCSAANTGSISVTVTGGTGSYTYNWSNNQQTANLNNVSGGNYSVTVSDANGCADTATATVLQTLPVTATETHTNINCNGGNTGAIHVTPAGGSGTYFYQWSTTATTQNLTGLTANNYSVTIADANNCKDTLAITLTEPAAIQLSTTVVHPGCSGPNTGAVYLTANGGTGNLQYIWSNNATTATITNVQAGYYTATVTDAATCTATITAAVSQALPLQITFSKTDATCFGGNNATATATVTGGSPGTYLYHWSNGDTTATVTGLTAGTYSVTVNDGGGCQSMGNITAGQATAIQIGETHTGTQCTGPASASITLSPSGGSGAFTYLWSTGDTTRNLNNLSPNTYTVTVTDAGNCTAQKAITITQGTALNVSETHNDFACNTHQGSIDLSVNGGVQPYTFNWGNGVVTEDRSQLSQGNYMVTVTDQAGCSASKVISISAVTALGTTIQKTDAGCYGENNGSIQVNVTGGAAPYTFNWNNSAQTPTIDHLYAGSYSVNITDANGCNASNSAVIAQSAPVQLGNYIEPVSCFGGNNGSINLTVSGGTAPYGFQWTNGSQNEDNLQLTAGNYSVTVVDAAGCKGLIENMQVTQPAEINVQSNVTQPGCAPGSTGSIGLSVNGGVPPYAFHWSTNDTSYEINNLQAGDYIVTVTDKVGCPVTRNLSITQLQALQITPAVQNTPCVQQQSGAITLTVTGGLGDYTYLWNNNATSETLTNLAEGTYTVTVNDISGCSGQATVNVTHQYDLTVDASNYVTISMGESTELSATASVNHNNVYSWYPNMLMDCANCATTRVSPGSTTTYTVNVVDINGCTATDTVTVEVNSVSNVYIPNAFSPNNDGSNDVFTMYGDNSSLRYLDFKIFNRWGEKIFESNNHNFMWDGTYKGEVVAQGVYIYTAQMVFSNGDKKEYKGSVTVLQ